jgi:P pilus assembly chaperone PapD
MVLGTGFAVPAKAMSVTPVHVEMGAAGSTARTQITVTNSSDKPMPVETAIEKLSLDEAGNRKTAKAGEEFLVFPPQAIIPPGGTQVFRVQWVGEPMLDKSESYLLSISQVPVKFPKGQSRLQVVMSFGVVINVAAAQGSPSLKIVSTGTTTDGNGKRRPTITVENSSKMHALLPDGTLALSGGSWSHTMSSTEMREKIGIGLVQPGKRRRFVLPVELPQGAQTVQANLDWRPKR